MVGHCWILGSNSVSSRRGRGPGSRHKGRSSAPAEAKPVSENSFNPEISSGSWKRRAPSQQQTMDSGKINMWARSGRQLRAQKRTVTTDETGRVTVEDQGIRAGQREGRWVLVVISPGRVPEPVSDWMGWRLVLGSTLSLITDILWFLLKFSLISINIFFGFYWDSLWFL